MTAFTSHVLPGGVEVFTLAGPDLDDTERIAEIRDDIVARLGEVGRPRIVLDLGHVEFLASAALGMLLVIRTATLERDGEVRIARIAPHLADVFRTTRLDTQFGMYDSVEDAAASLTPA